MSLTQQQAKLLRIIKQSTIDGIAPSFEEMKDAMELTSKSGIHRLLSGLEERGYIDRMAKRARAIELTEKGEKEILRSQGFNGIGDSSRREKAVPLYGKIAAGMPIEALQNASTFIVPPPGIPTEGRYALMVEGDSMIEAGIFPGDTVFIKTVDTIENGEIGVVLIDDLEATLKRVKFEGDKVRLESANSKYEPRVVPANTCRIQGKLEGLVRKY